MKINLKSINWQKIGIIFGTTLLSIYVLFLALPFIISPIANSYREDIEKIIKEATGLESNIEGLGIITTPMLEIGVKIKDFSIFVPNSKIPTIEIVGAKGNIKLLPLVMKKVQLGSLSANEIIANVNVKKDGEFEIQEYLLPEDEEAAESMNSLPMGLKLSNHLPNVKIKDYKLSFIDSETGKSYYIDGNNLKISDFILDKKIKFSADGQIVFDKRVVSNYDIKIFNKIMPKFRLDDLIFPKEVKTEGVDNPKSKSNAEFDINVIDIFEGINKNEFKADLNMDVKTSGTFKNPIQKGSFEINGISVAVNGKKLPESYAKLIFKGKKTDINSMFFTSYDTNERTQLIGNIQSGKNANIDMTLRSNAKFENVIRLVDSIAQSFGCNDLKTIRATGGIDADFNINSDMKKVLSTGYLKIEPSSLRYDLYGVSVDNIVADIDFMNNNVDIKKAGFLIMGHPLNFTGTISSDAVADLKLIADKLSLKGLIVTAGQVNLLKENDFNSGTLSLKALIKGKLTEIKPDINLSVNNINVYNKVAEARLLLNDVLVKLLIDGEKISGDIGVNALKIKHDMASVSVPSAKVSMDTKDINISNTYVLINNSKVDVTGSVKDYLTENLKMNIQAKGNMSASDILAFIPVEFRSMFPAKGSMPLNINVTGDVKSQNISADLSATPEGYLQFLDINKLKNKNTKIHSDIKLSGDSLRLENTGIYAGKEAIVTCSGLVKNFVNPNLNINIHIPNNISFPIPGMGENSNITLNGSIDVSGGLDDPKIKGKVNLGDVSIKDMDFVLSDVVASFNDSGFSGGANARKMKFGGIIASNIVAKFSLVNNFTLFNLSDIAADAFSGKVKGKISYNIPNFAVGVDLTGKGMNSMDAVYGAIGIPKALTGTLGFVAKFTAKGVTDKEIIQSMKGDVSFDISDGRFISIGKLENLIMAQNIESYSVLKSAVSALSTFSAVQETDKFQSIVGSLKFSDGVADILSINVSGPLMSYYVKGTYNILPNTAKFLILGRLDSKIISYLGPVGQLSADKLLAYIPKIGESTAKFLNVLTQNPADEKTELIPNLSSGSKSYKDFKVIFNGNIEKSSSVKSFKWLSVCDTTKMNVKEDMRNAAQATKDSVKDQINSAKTTVENVKSNAENILNTQKQNIAAQKQNIEQTKKNVENVKQNATQNAKSLGNILLNAASKANQKYETKTETQSESTTESKTE